MKKVCILGAGAWGTAIATVLAHNGHQIKLWCREPEVAKNIKTNRINERYLPGVILSPLIEPITDLKDALCGAEYVFEAVPVKFLRSILEQTKSCFSPEQTFVILSKGIEQETLMLPSQIIDDVFGYSVKKAVIAGPSFAQDLAQKSITAVSLAAQDCAIGTSLQEMMATPYFRPYISLDMIGVQVGAALKNVITLAIGMLEGAGYGDNVKAYILTRGLHEMEQIAVKLGGKTETLYGLSGIGDLVLTGMGSMSKNLAIGKELGSGKTLQELETIMHTLPEGINTAASVHQLMTQYALDLPVCQGVYSIIFQNMRIEDFLQKLMARPLEAECAIKILE